MKERHNDLELGQTDTETKGRKKMKEKERDSNIEQCCFKGELESKRD